MQNRHKPIGLYVTSDSPFVLMAIFPGEPGLAGFIGAKDNENGGDN